MPPKKKAKEKPVLQRSLITTIPVIRPCQVCGVWLAAGIAEGIHVQADLTPLDSGQAMIAVLSRIQLFCLTRTGLVHLDQSRIQAPFGAIYPEHRHGLVWPVKLQGGGAWLAPQTDDSPPY
jgi:hypothetical protein